MEKNRLLLYLGYTILSLFILSLSLWFSYWYLYLPSRPFNENFFQEKCNENIDYPEDCPVLKCRFNVYMVPQPERKFDYGPRLYNGSGEHLQFLNSCYMPRFFIEFKSRPFAYLFCNIIPELKCEKCLCGEINK